MARSESNYVRLLLEKALEKIGKECNGEGFSKLADKLNMLSGERFSTKYLRENLWYQVKDDTNNTPRKFSSRKLDKLARFVSCADFNSFCLSISRPLPPALKKCEGNWWSLVRANAGDFILKAPVRICPDEKGGMQIEMQGGQKLFKGSVRLRADNIFCELDSEIDKIFYIVLKVGINEKVNVLQGVFAGISSAAEPIGGREIFLRAEEKNFEGMKWQKLRLDDESLEAELRFYFKNYDGNCIKVKGVSRFTLGDLMSPDAE